MRHQLLWDQLIAYLLFPCVLVTKVWPMFLVWKVAGAFTSYQSFFVKGSTLSNTTGTDCYTSEANITSLKAIIRSEAKTISASIRALLPPITTRPQKYPLFPSLFTILPYIFFLEPFFPFVSLLFLPTAMLAQCALNKNYYTA